MRIRYRYQLVFILAAVQFACLGAGIVTVAGWLRIGIRETVHEQVLANNVQIARQLTKLIREMRIGDVRTNPEAWQKMQSLVRDIQLPNEGYVCLVDSDDGSLLCHPGFVDRPPFAPREEQRTVDHSRADKVSGGVVGADDTLQIIAAAEIPSMHAKLLVHQMGRSIDRTLARVLSPLVPIGMTVAALLTATMILSLSVVIRRYDNRLADANEELEERVQQRTRSLSKTRDAVIFGLAKLAESRDTDTGEHLERIRTYVTLLAEQLEKSGTAIDERTTKDIGLASSLHDIGKVGVPDRVLLKPGRLDADEYAEMQKHAAVGGDCLEAIGARLGEDDFLQLAKEIAYGHHEKWDGTGYPAKVAGDSIPLSARIVALADVYDALRSRRPYKEPMSHEKAREIVLEGRGAHFDPAVVEAFLACEEQFIEVSERSNLASLRDHAGAEQNADACEAVSC